MNALVQYPLLEVLGVSKRLGGRPVLDRVSLGVDRGEVLCILGASGSGKSTLLRCINQLETADDGAVVIDGVVQGKTGLGPDAPRLPDRMVRRQRADAAMVFQGFHLFPHMTVLDNLTLGPVEVRGRARIEAEANARMLLERMRLGEFERTFPRRLSGGQQQRVAIARALLMEPKLLLFDEPTSALDPELVHEVLGVIRELAEAGHTMVIVTHETGFARQIASRVVVLDAGRVIETGRAEDVLDHPRHERTRLLLNLHKDTAHAR